MRTRALVALTTGALALTALNLPTAYAGERSAASDGPSRTPAAAEAPVEPTITDVSVNHGRDLVVGVRPRTFTVTFTARDDSRISSALAALWWGGELTGRPYRLVQPYHGSPAVCTAVDPTTSTCAARLVADPADPDDRRDLTNEVAGRWHVAVLAQSADGGAAFEPQSTTHLVKRAARLTVDAGPEPVGPGGNLTVTGALRRANWDTHAYAGYTVQPVELQFRAKGAASWSTLTTVRTDNRGALRTTVRASVDGYYRYHFAGTTTTPAVTSTADFVDVR